MVYTLNIKDMREVALILTEHGFAVEGINALPKMKELAKKKNVNV
jgi:stage III sporulation protein SpoIIIAA